MNLNRLHFSIDIKAEKSKIWKALWNEDSYRDWAGVFFEGSYVITENWKEGTKVMFLSPDQSGIYSVIEKHIPNKLMKFKHCGPVIKGKEQTIDNDELSWAGATEKYTINEGSGFNTLSVDIDVLDEHLDFMKKTLPKALEKVKYNSMQ